MLLAHGGCDLALTAHRRSINSPPHYSRKACSCIVAHYRAFGPLSQSASFYYTVIPSQFHFIALHEKKEVSSTSLLNCPQAATVHLHAAHAASFTVSISFAPRANGAKC
jgi:hypothetical protein